MTESGGPRWPGSAADSADEAWLTAIAQAAAGDSQAPLELLVEYLSLLADAAISGRRPREHELAIVRELGRRAAERGSVHDCSTGPGVSTLTVPGRVPDRRHRALVQEPLVAGRRR
ncbi:hypothetical protein ACWEOO_33955 [Kribbella sp. NPDC004138]